MAVLCQLADPGGYRVSTWNLLADEAVAAHWLDLFASFPGRFEKHLLADGLAGDDFEARWATFEPEYTQGLAAMRVEAERVGELHTIDLCRFYEDGP